MSRRRNGFNFELTAWGNNKVNVYLSQREAKAFIYFIEVVSISNDGCIDPYELAHYLWPEKYPEFSALNIDQSHIYENGVTEAMSVVSNIISTFRTYIKQESIIEIYDPFPFFIMDDPRSDFRAITITDGLSNVKYFLHEEKQTKE